MKKCLIPLFLALLGFVAPSPDSPVLTITGNGTPGSTVDVDVAGATPDAWITVVASMQDIGVIYKTPWGTIQFDIGPKMFLVSKGKVDANGDFHDDFILPKFPPQASGRTVYFQGVEAVRSGNNVIFTTTNVSTLVLQ